MLRVAMVVLGTLLTVWYMLPFFSRRILNIGNATGIGIGVLVILLGIFLKQVRIFFAECYLKGGWHRVLLTMILVFVAMVIILAVLCSCKIIKGANKKPEENATVVVLGCKVYGERPSLMLMERLDAAYDYLVAHPDAACVVSGGKGSDEDIPEAEAMYTYLVKKGIDPSRIYQEDKSTNTRENLTFSYEIIKENQLEQTLAIATNEFHEYRAIYLANDLGLVAGAVPGHTAWWLFPTYFTRELYGVLSQCFF